MSEEDSFLRNLIFRLVRKHIAGPTIATALKAAKELNEDNINATLTFLNDHVDKQSKAKYNYNAYVQLIHQISRLNISADVSVRISQFGYNINKRIAINLLTSLIDNAENLGICLWLEYESGMSVPNVYRIYKNNSSKNFGIEIPAKFLSEEKVLKIISGSNNIKILISRDIMDKKTDNTKKDKEQYGINFYINKIKKLSSGCTKFIISSHDEKLLSKMVQIDTYRKNLILEVPFGYNKRKINKLIKSKSNLNVYTPYGKDWISYAVNKLTEGKMHKIATRLLDGSKTAR